VNDSGAVVMMRHIGVIFSGIRTVALQLVPVEVGAEGH